MVTPYSKLKRIELNCVICGKPFTAVLVEIKRGRGSHTCGRQCYRVLKGFDKDDAIREMLSAGSPFKDIRIQLKVSHQTISKLAHELGWKKREPYLQHDWKKISAFYATGATYAECTEKFGVKSGVLSKAAKRGLFIPRPQSVAISAVEHIKKAEGKRNARGKIREKIIKEGLIPYTCAICGINEWQGLPLTLRLDHIDGDGRRHALDNLRFLCPNCDSQQPTFGHRNRGRYDKDYTTAMWA